MEFPVKVIRYLIKIIQWILSLFRKIIDLKFIISWNVTYRKVVHRIKMSLEKFT